MKLTLTGLSKSIPPLAIATMIFIFLSVSYAAELPLAVEIDKQTEIISASIKNQDCPKALKHIDKLQSLSNKLPLTLLFAQGSCFYNLGLTEKAYQALKSYLSLGKNAESNYQQALAIFILVESERKQLKEQQQRQIQAQEEKQKHALERQNEIESRQRRLRMEVAQIEWPMIAIKPGCFYMGSLENEEEKPMHRVCLDKAFAIGQYEVTRQQWQAVMQNTADGSKSVNNMLCKSVNCPITSISWQTIQIFIDKLNQLTQKRYRLPSEAEWEYACRNLGKNQRSCIENNISSLNVPYDKRLKKNIPVNTTSKNDIGIQGMNNNAYEWMQDYFSDIYFAGSPVNNPQGPSTGTTRVIRSGCCISYKNRTNINRFGQEQIFFDNRLGFRLVEDL